MAGHSKWSNIKHRKARQDAKRAKVWTKLIREITVAARLGGGDPADVVLALVRWPGAELRLQAPGFVPNLARRVGTALVALPALLAALFLGPPWLVVGRWWGWLSTARVGPWPPPRTWRRGSSPEAGP